MLVTVTVTTIIEGEEVSVIIIEIEMKLQVVYILCGYKNHKAENCRNMKDDNGNVNCVIPGFGTCSKCPKEIQPRLNHPESLCPFRPKGPLYKRTPA
jgi:hypothetical protein